MERVPNLFIEVKSDEQDDRVRVQYSVERQRQLEGEKIIKKTKSITKTKTKKNKK